MKKKIFLGIFILLFANVSFGQTKYEKDFNEFWNDINSNYAYLDQQKIDWNKVRKIYETKAKEVKNNDEFIQFMESVINELHNGHNSLNTNINESNRLVPSGQDMRVEEIEGKFKVTDLRKGFPAELAGLKIGNEIIGYNGKSIKEQLVKFLPKYTTSYSPEMQQYALDMLFAGTHNTKRVITINENGVSKDYFPDSIKFKKSLTLLDKRILSKKTAYIKINNSLGDNNLIGEFDKAVDEFLNYENIVIDLTETPSGGNTTVGRSIMGRFINKTMPFQQHEFDEKEYETKRMWVEYVTPRKTQFKGKVFILVGHWTGSMGEGIAIGFDGMNRSTIIGTKMAGLIGAIDGFILSQTKLSYQVPTERLYHINGTPRELFKPTVMTKNIEETIDKMNELK
ncbi:MAG: S41 family peptidase [Sediminibacterium sp.]|jgi:C-terminal processing protease CtpA/Prc|nr:peptidase [Chitinophagaceae bacterium]MCE2974664.1 S41 family peptidase [Sediminibacterium sp.]